MNDPLQPPGAAERVQAASALVVAPHYDDEVLGCGGLVAQLAASGAAVRVLFLTDGEGTEAPDRDAYRSRRREESAKVASILGLAGTDHLHLPDGQLDQHLEQLVQGLRRALLSVHPEILLIPSPFEVSRDHRAAFAALHHLLSPLRGHAERPGGWRSARLDEGGSRACRRAGNGAATGPAEPDESTVPDDSDIEIFSSLRILLYEINHPAHPDLLVDVSAQAAVLAEAMAAYASQEEQHGYLAAALGLRRFRTLTLPAGVDLAEGYRLLSPADFATRSPAQLIRHLGGIPEVLEVREGPLISVVVRTKDRPELLAEALGSLAAGAYRRAEVVLVNDGGAAPVVPADYPLPVVRVDLPETQGRAAAAEAGVAAATGDYVAFLDDDDLAAPEHLATLAGLVSAAGVRVAYTDAAVAIYELDPAPGEGGWVCRERRLPYSRDFDPEVLLVDNYIPFNTLLIERRLFAEAGPFDPELPFFEDWDFLIRLAALVPFHHRAQVTCEYRHFRGGGHHVFGETPSERGDFLEVKAKVLGKHAARLTPERLAAAVDTLRAELVAEREARAAARLEIARRAAELAGLSRAHQELSRERFALEERFHATRGELAVLTAGHERLRADAQRLYGEEANLRAAVDDQTAHLGRTYAEIERLNRVIGEMEATRAWRLHRWWHRRS